MNIKRNESDNHKINRIVDKPFYSIAEFANLFGISTQALRYYHREKLLIPDKIKDNGYRYYGYNQIYQLATIVYLRKSNFSIEDIRAYLQASSYQHNVSSLKKTVADMSHQIIELQRLINILQTRIHFVEEWEKNIDLNEEKVVMLPPHRYVILGQGEADYIYQGFFSIPTFVIYKEQADYSYRLIMGGLLDEKSEDELPERADIKTTPGGQYLIAYHKGSYTGCYDRICKLRKEHSAYQFSDTTYCINIIDPFIVQRSDQFVTRLELPIIGKS